MLGWLQQRVAVRVLRRPRSAREGAVRILIMGLVIAAGAGPFFLGEGASVEEIASEEFRAQLEDLAATRNHLAALRADPSANPGALRALEERITRLERATYIGYLPREGDGWQEGRLAPDFRLLDLAGNPLRLTHLDRPVVLNFWADWCGFCKLEMPDFQELQDQLGDAVRVVGVNREDGPELAARVVAERGVRYTILLDVDDLLGGSGGPYRIIGMPMTYYIGADGRVFRVQPGWHELPEMETIVSEMLAATAGAERG